ncbi:MAG TPA: EfeM/EfeO family lipoprotein [Ilumatobacteraceae bacterium]|nr:EfeM/EfeO family lipoprotein [Ilumatobacteraceae bacterium]
MKPFTSAVTVALTIVGVSACTDNTASEGGPIAVVSTDTECKVARTEAKSGNLVFDVKNGGDKVTEFYLLGSDGLRIIGEIENIGADATRKLVVKAAPGKYFTSCKPGMVGDGIRASFTVTDSGTDMSAASDVAELLATATDQYRLYVRDQVATLVEKTTQFTDLYKANKDDEARALYAPARVHWERIEPVAESFGDLDPRLDLREADLEAGQEWTGWHRIEKDLWPPSAGYTAMTAAERATIADRLAADTADLSRRVEQLTFNPDQLGNGAKELLDEVATGKVTGEEEAWSHTDLWDVQANVDGARIAFENLRPALLKKDKTLAETLTTKFAELQTLLNQFKRGDGFVYYNELTAEQVSELSRTVDALGEPLATLTAAVVL